VSYINQDYSARRGNDYRSNNQGSSSSSHGAGGGNNDRYSGPTYNSGGREPEWMTGGPVSRSDTIELRGFDDKYDGGGASGRRGGEYDGGGAKEKSLCMLTLSR